ncbi:SBBP repeat-containing protein (plasmid) [Deinococcus taeanensis]|uniref:SBBP repeat-containing protein n=1 Tax=Deinococcus taeanensis TaxID=2737050 RepID=UPI001CDC32D1|nr:SBBP repeat-containing protein [Deinococcus taeanensis]UBV45257.1 SBBP repeat-containing protein [Deinococcus taeanensis]
MRKECPIGIYPTVTSHPQVSVGAALLLSAALIGCSPPADPPSATLTGGLLLEAEAAEVEATLTPETVTDPRSGGRPIIDADASGGRAIILLGTNDLVRFTVPHHLPAGRYRIAIRGRGEQYEGAPIVALSNGTRQRIGTATLDNTAYAVKPLGEADVRPGETLHLTFLNDLYAGRGWDRNAIVDYLVIEPVGASSSFLRQFGTDQADDANAVTSDGHGSTYVVGTTNGAFPGQTRAHPSGPELFVRKVDVNGRELWTRQLGATTSAHSTQIYPADVRLDAAGNLYVCGLVHGRLPGFDGENFAGDAFVLKYTPDGTLAWSRQFSSHPSWHDDAEAVTIDASGNVYVVGNTVGAFDPAFNPLVGEETSFIRKYSPDGRALWTRQFAATESVTVVNGTQRLRSGSAVSDAGMDTHGNLYVTGNTRVPFPGQRQSGKEDGFLQAYAPDGSERWTRQFGTGAAGDAVFPRGLAVDASGNSYLAGNVYGTFPGQANSGAGDAFLSKFLSDGAAAWTRQWGDADTEQVRAVAIGPDSQAFVTWHSLPSTSGGVIDVFVKRFAANGAPGMQQQIATPANDFSGDVHVDSSGHVYVAGSTEGVFPGQRSEGELDAFVMKMAPARP